MSVFLALPLLAATGLYNRATVSPREAVLTRFTVRHPDPRHFLIAIATLRSRSGESGAAAIFAGRCLVGRAERPRRTNRSLSFGILYPSACRLPELRYSRLLGVLTDARSCSGRAVTFPQIFTALPSSA